jgi:hypothetical protein
MAIPELTHYTGAYHPAGEALANRQIAAKEILDAAHKLPAIHNAFPQTFEEKLYLSGFGGK